MSSSKEPSAVAEEAKARGNAAFAACKFQEAIDEFTKGLQVQPDNHILFSNRSAAFCSLGKYQEALNDAEMAVSLKPDWPKAYSRKGAALHGKGLYQEAEAAFQQGLQLDPHNEQMKNALSQAQAAESQKQAQQSKSFPNPFSAPDAIGKLAANPKTAHLVSDAAFLAKFHQLQSDPKKLTMMFQDPQIMQALGVLLGIDLMAATGESEGNQNNESCKESTEKQQSSEKESSSKTESSFNDQSNDQSNADSEALALKERANACYKARNFSEALELYEKALEIASPTLRVSILLNISAVQFEQNLFTECIEKCNQVVEEARACFADFSLVAKALARIGNCWLHQKQPVDIPNLEKAIEFFRKSITEHRNPQIVTLLGRCERDLATLKKEAYRDPVISEQERNKGNEFFKQGKWVEALGCYSEAIKRNDKDPKNFSNRAATYMKLAAFPEALKDCEVALELDPTFVKAYIRKAAIMFLKKDYSKCIETCQEGMKYDAANEELKSQLYNAYQAISSANQQSSSSGAGEGVNDPEVQSILMDPIMRSILEQAQQDPKALMEHMKNPVVASKINKLISAGIIKTR